MATYKGIQGYSVQKLSSDPAASEAVGQLWYNSGSAKFKVGTQAVGAWAAGGDLNAARYRWMGGFGTTSTGIVVGGLKTPGYSASALVEEYNGSAWSEIADIPARADNWATGTPTAGISGTGTPYMNTVYEFNGTSWTAGGDYPETSIRTNASGTQTATLAQGGAPPPGSYSNVTAEYNGVAWALGGVYPSVHANGAQCGTQTAGFAIGGYNPGTTVDCNEYNGASWTETTDTNTGHGECGGSQSGTTTAAMVVAGAPGTPGETEIWNGTSWTEVADLTSGRGAGASVGTSGSAMYMGGSPVSPGVLTEVWSDPVYTIKTVTVS